MKGTSLYQVHLASNTGGRVTAGVEVSPDGVVVNTAPILNKFMGVRIEKLAEWAGKKGGYVKQIRRESP